jgi:hypothetical protein
MGPWMFERLNVPAKYACSPPNIRLEGDFCGTPIAGVQVFAWMIFWVLNIVAGLITHKTALANSGFEFLIGLIYSLLLFLLILPIINMVRLLLRRFYLRRGLFTIISLVLAIGVSLFLGFFNYPNFHWAAWGIWLYVGLAVIALILEIVLFREQNRQDPDLTVTSVENEVTVN